MKRNGILLAALAAVAAALAAGCTQGGRVERPAPPAGLDPLAEQLHDICGNLLWFESMYHRLPRSVDELCLATGLDARRVIDPVTGKPFAYDPAGFAASQTAERILLVAAPAPAAKTRWCVSMVQAGGTSTCRVIAVPADAFGEVLTGRTPAAPSAPPSSRPADGTSP
jgi:hypothetical protein